MNEKTVWFEISGQESRLQKFPYYYQIVDHFSPKVRHTKAVIISASFSEILLATHTK